MFLMAEQMTVINIFRTIVNQVISNKNLVACWIYTCIRNTVWPNKLLLGKWVQNTINRPKRIVCTTYWRYGVHRTNTVWNIPRYWYVFRTHRHNYFSKWFCSHCFIPTQLIRVWHINLASNIEIIDNLDIKQMEMQ